MEGPSLSSRACLSEAAFLVVLRATRSPYLLSAPVWFGLPLGLVNLKEHSLLVTRHQLAGASGVCTYVLLTRCSGA